MDFNEINQKLTTIGEQLEEIKRMLPRLALINYRENGEEKQEVVWVDSYGNSIDINKLSYGSIREMQTDIYNLPPKEEISHWNSNIRNGDKE